ncbi:LysR family transcriptional regulator [Pseudomonas costantinii]|nr:LysR family transcriptional regulator [Pseudomonas costantinii]
MKHFSSRRRNEFREHSVFLRVVERGSFTAAANQLNVAVPKVSKK